MEYGSCRSFTQCKQVPVGHMKLSLPSLLSLFIFSNVKTWTEPLHLPWFRKYDSHKNCFESFVSTILKKTFRLKSKLVKVTTTGSQPYLRIKLKPQYIVVHFYKYSSLKYFFPRVCCDINQRHLKPNLISSPLSPQWKSELTIHNLSLTITDNRSRCHCRANQSPVIRNQNG